MVAMVTVLGMAVGLLVSVLLVYLNVTPLRKQWQATTKLVGPGIERVLIQEHQATIEGEASTESRITFAIGGEEYESCGFKKNGRFTATVRADTWGDGLDISVVDADGNRLLTSRMRTGERGPRFPGDSPMKPQPDGTIQIAEVCRTIGDRLPLTVRLSLRQRAAGPIPDSPTYGRGFARPRPMRPAGVGNLVSQGFPT